MQGFAAEIRQRTSSSPLLDRARIMNVQGRDPRFLPAGSCFPFIRAEGVMTNAKAYILIEIEAGQTSEVVMALSELASVRLVDAITGL